MNKVKIRHQIEEKLLRNGDILRVEYNPREHICLKEDLIYVDGYLCDENRNRIMEITSVYVDNIELKIDNKQAF